jgi:hypothetical protein
MCRETALFDEQLIETLPLRTEALERSAAKETRSLRLIESAGADRSLPHLARIIYALAARRYAVCRCAVRSPGGVSPSWRPRALS